METIQGWYDYFPYATCLLLILPNRLDKAEAIYEENGCSSVKGYSKRLSLLFRIPSC